LAFALGLGQYLLSDRRPCATALPADSKRGATPIQSSGWR
jgi:hypothetical protein